MNRKTLVLPALTGVLAVAVAGCGGDQDSAADAEAIVVGTTDHFEASKETPAPFDPAAAYSVASWNVLRNTYQTLLRLPRSGTEPEPEAAEQCSFTDSNNEQFRCTVRDDLSFSNGNKLDAKDVEFSVKRMMAIDDPNGPASLLSNLDRVEAPSETEVVFHLKKPDATFPYKVATPAVAIVDDEVYPADGLYEGTEIAASGPYTLDSFEEEKATFVKNAEYRGKVDFNNEKIEMRFFPDGDKMEAALRDGELDVVNRTLAPEQVRKLENVDGINVQGLPSQGIRYLVFNTDKPAVEDEAVRKAVAQLVDRQALVRDVYDRTAEPLYSIVPGGLPGHRNSFFNSYGEPDKGDAQELLENAGIQTPVELELTYTSDYYGSATKGEFEMIRDQLNRSGLFEVTVKGEPWQTYRPNASDRKYEVYGMGWFPDFPDPENFIAPFFGENNFLNSPYRSSEIIDDLLPLSRTRTERTAANEDFIKIQDIVAEEVPVLPLWQSKQYVVAKEEITGVEWALNSSSVLQLWELGRGATLE